MRGQNEITNSADMIDSRDVIDRIAYLTGENENMALSEEESAELAALVALAAEAGDYAPDWTHVATLIRDSYFEDYARELAEDIGAVKDDASWPYTCIDWDRAARELQMDYTSVEFGDATYWVR